MIGTLAPVSAHVKCHASAHVVVSRNIARSSIGRLTERGEGGRGCSEVGFRGCVRDDEARGGGDSMEGRERGGGALTMK